MRNRSCPLAFPLFVFACCWISASGCSSMQRLPGWMTVGSKDAEHAVPVNWTTSFDEASRMAAADEKIVMLWFTGSDWCKYCTMLEEEVFHTAEFNEWYPDKLIPVMVDFPRQSSLPREQQKQNDWLKSEYANHVTSYPTALFINSRGQVLGKLGYLDGGPEHWIHQAENILAVTW